METLPEPELPAGSRRCVMAVLWPFMKPEILRRPEDVDSTKVVSIMRRAKAQVIDSTPDGGETYELNCPVTNCEFSFETDTMDGKPKNYFWTNVDSCQAVPAVRAIIRSRAQPQE